MPAPLTGTHLQDAVLGSPQHLGTIIATTTKNNHDTAVPFNNTGDALKGKILVLQSDAACYVRAGTTNAVTATTGTAGTAGVKVEANEKFYLRMRGSDGWVACLSVAGTATVQVWELQ